MHLELTGFRLLFCLAAVIHNITPTDMNVRGCVVVVIHNVVGDGVGCRTFGPAPGPILLYKGNKGQRGNIRAGHNDLVRVGGPDRLVEGGQLLPDGGRQRHGGSQAALLAESPLEMHPGPPVREVKLDRQRAKGVVAGIRAVSIVYEFLGPLAKKFHIVDTAESVLDHPHRLISISRRFFSVGDRESLDGGGEGNGHGIFVSDLVWAQVRVEEDRLLVGTLQRGPEGPTCVHRFRKRSGRGGARIPAGGGQEGGVPHGEDRLLQGRLDQFEKTGPGVGEDFDVGVAVVGDGHGGNLRGHLGVINQKRFHIVQVDRGGRRKCKRGVVKAQIKDVVRIVIGSRTLVGAGAAPKAASPIKEIGDRAGGTYCHRGHGDGCNLGPPANLAKGDRFSHDGGKETGK